VKLVKFSICFIFVFAGFTGVFRYGEWMPIYQYGILIALLFSFTKKWYFNKEDLSLLICFIILFFSSILSPNDKTLNYILAYIYTFFILYKNLDNLSRTISLEKLLKFNAVGIFISSFYSCLEFFSSFFLNVKISEFLPRVKETTAIYMVGVDRSYGFATEPTSLALYLNILGPFAILYWKNNLSSVKFKVYTTILILGWCFTFSASAFLFLFLSILVVCIIVYRLKIIKLIFKNILILILFFSSIFYGISSGFLDKIIGKIFLSDGGTSSSQRFMVFDLAINRFLENPITGIGLGYTSSVDEMSPINWYLIILSNGGVFAFLFILIFMLLIFKKALIIKNTFSVLPAIGILSGVFGFLTISTFYNPFFWLAIILINIMKQIHDKNSRCL
jgi:hypothetical protein